MQQQQQQQQQQNDVVTGVQPMYVAHPNQTSTVVNSYKRGQSTVIGVLLIIVGCLSISCNSVDLVFGSQHATYVSERKIDPLTWYWHYTLVYDGTLSHKSLGVVAHGFWSGIMVSFLVHFL